MASVDCSASKSSKQDSYNAIGMSDHGFVKGKSQHVKKSLHRIRSSLAAKLTDYKVVGMSSIM
jgi:hypothetical protein